MMIVRAASVLAVLLVGQQQQVASAWWFFPSSSEQPAVSNKQQEQRPPSYQGPANQPKAASSLARAVQQPPVGVDQAQSAIAKFNMDGVEGFIRFSQSDELAPTRVEYSLSGLKNNNRLYHVHVRPVPKFDPDQVSKNATLRGQVCGDPSTGGHLNPHHITQRLPPKSAPFDKYETGDLGGKHGPLSLDPSKGDFYQGTFVDDKLPMSGENSIVGRSLVIHKNDGARWVCASIERESVASRFQVVAK